MNDMINNQLLKYQHKVIYNTIYYNLLLYINVVFCILYSLYCILYSPIFWSLSQKIKQFRGRSCNNFLFRINLKTPCARGGNRLAIITHSSS